MHHAFPYRPRRYAFVTIIGVLALLIAGCSASDLNSVTGGTTPPCANSGSATCATGAGIQNAMLTIEPAAGDAPVVQAIKGAQHTIDMEMYLLTEKNVENALEDAAHRGVTVRVMLETHPVGAVTPSPQQTLDTLNAAGVTAKATAPAFRLTHAKLMIVDGKTAFISTANFSKSALGGSSSATNREFIIADTESADVQECSMIYNADWNHTTPTLSDPNLVVSPVNARAKEATLIASAKTSLHLEDEEMQDPATIQELIAAAKRGVQVKVVVPKPSSGGADAAGEQQLTQGGVQVKQIDDRKGGGYYIHAKSIIVDTTEAFVGSENASAASLDDNREIGVLIANQQVIQQLEQTFAQDFG